MILNEVVGKLKPVLDDYAVQLAQVEERIRKNGTIDSSVCRACSRKDILEVIKQDGEHTKAVRSFFAWIRENDVRGLNSSGETLAFQSSLNKVEGVEGNIPLLHIGQALSATAQRVLYDYRISVERLKKKDFAPLLKIAFADLESCPHVKDIGTDTSLALVSKTKDDFARGVEKLWQKSDVVNHYLICCKECFGRIDSIGCETSIRKRAFAFVHSCPTREILFRAVLDKNRIKYIGSEGENQTQENQLMLSLPDLNTFVSDSPQHVMAAVDLLHPETLLVFGPKELLPACLQYGTNVMLFDPDAAAPQLTVFDTNLQVEESEERIIEAIVSNLDHYSSEVRGKEHDKLVEAFKRIGGELGYIPQAELPGKGARVDVAWLDKKAGVHVAIEVETSAQWKKDVVTTWETSPRLAIILTHYKTDKGVEDIVQYNLLRYMPHRLLFISYLQKKAYLLERGSIIRSYVVASAH